ncbi:hypothetical protein [Acinetobacter nosocomialis]|uniref:hypothetical protein n=1 Tax=Acinetobacter nosocomialis TaxID=106654 RepID=UPI001B82AE6D|nr:hypothetical protein [Acinetobacter nosocomialis]MBR7729162.1 hypothetical protein [Acinetobacter nosocomialis]MBS0033204.1 hypothetical protein [Acinetobacter nosocomialis]
MQYSFNGGVISPDMFGRIDQAKYQTGVAKCKNLYVELFGGVVYRAGFRYVHHYPKSMGKMRLIRFVFSEEQAVVLAIRAGAINFFADGGMLLNENNDPLEVAVPYAEEHLMQLRYAQSADVVTITHPNYPPRKIIRKSATEWITELVTVGYGIGTPQNVSATAHIEDKYKPGGSMHDSYIERDYSYQVTAVNEQNESAASLKVVVQNDLTLAGNYNTITWDAVTGANRYNIFKLRSGLASFIGETTETSFTDDNIETNGSITPPLIRNPFEFYPTAVAYHGQRKVYGGGYKSPQWIRMSRTATDDNFGYHIPTQDTDSIQIRFAARDGNGVKHLVTMSDLLILTSGALWKMSADGAVTAASVNMNKQYSTGANDVTPVEVDGATIFSSDQTGHVHEISLASGYNASFYQTIDLSIMCPQLFDGQKIIDCALLRNPLNIIYFVRGDGVLLSLTYEPKQQVWAWAEHHTNGKFLSIAEIPEDDQSVLYAFIERDGFYTIERMLTRQPLDMQDKCYLDSSIQYKGGPTSTLTGLDWLEGQTVSVFADGGVKPDTKVENGTIKLPRELSNIWVGLNYEAELQTLPIFQEQKNPVKPKVVNKVHLRVRESQNILVGANQDIEDRTPIDEFKPRSNERYGSPLKLYSGLIEVPVDSTYERDIQITVKHDKPLPMKLLALEVEMT